MFQTGFAMDADFHALNPTTFIVLFHLPIGQPLAPAQDGTTCPRCPWAVVPTTEDLQEGGLIALIGIGENRRQMPCSKTIVGILHQGRGLLIGPFAHHKRTTSLLSAATAV